VRRLVPALGGAVLLSAVALALLLPEGAPSAPSADPERTGAGRQPAPVVEPAAWRLLDRAASAPGRVAYTGTQFVTAWAVGGTTSQVLEVSSSPASGTTWRAAGGNPGSGARVHAAADAADPSILGAGAVALLARHYSLTVAAPGRVAGRTTDVVEARLPDRAGAQGRVAARFWLDRSTGMVLRREVYDDHGRVIRASAFVDVDVSEADPAAAAGRAGRAWAQTLDDAAVRRMRARGWDCPEALPGPLPLVDARRGGERRQILHLSYADGIASISVFLQPGELDRERLDDYQLEEVGGWPVWVRAEVPRRVVWASGGMVFTVVADAPERTVDRAVRVLHQHGYARGGGPMDRLGRGLDRVASWFNPFE
jgi:sigma-E factor negative regulatory protein RseB